METIFRKISVNERLPKEGKFIFIQENGKIRLCEWDGRKADLDWIKNTSIKYWLEEIKFPTEKKMREQMNEHGKNVYQNTSDAQAEYSARFAFRFCYEWIRDKVIKSK